MTPALERRYRLLLRAYPASWRAQRGAEMLGTLAESARPGQRLPSPREAAGLVVGGLRAHALAGGGGTAEGMLADGLYLGVVLFHLVAAGIHVADVLYPGTGGCGDCDGVPAFVTRTAMVSGGMSILVVVALLRGWLAPAIALVVGRALAVQAISWMAPFGGDRSWDGLAYESAELVWSLYPAVVLAMLGHFGRRRTSWRPRALSPLWLGSLGATVLTVVGYRLVISPALVVGFQNLERLHSVRGAVLMISFMLAAVALTWLDPRLPIAGAFCASSVLLGLTLAGLSALPYPSDAGLSFPFVPYIEVAGFVMGPFGLGMFGIRRLVDG